MIRRLSILFFSLFVVLTGLSGQGSNPEPPVIRHVGVDKTTGHVTIDWQPDTTGNVLRYVIYEGQIVSDSLVGYPLDTLDVSVTTYTHLTSTPLTRSVPYTVASIYAFDTSPLAPYHYTIFTTVEYDSCNNRLIINWTPYVGWGDDLYAYNIYISTNQGDYVKISSLSPSSDNYEYADPLQNSDYCIYVEAESMDFLSSTSNLICLDTDRAYPPSYINADFATVTTDNKIQLQFSFDPVTQLHNFILFYGNQAVEVVVPVAEINNVTSTTISHTQDVFSINKKSYYQLAVVDLCPEKNPVKKSNLASNIVLQATESNYIVTLQWDDYINWQAGIKYYHVYRITNKDNIEKIDSLSFGINSVTDNLTMLKDNDNLISDEICYYVEAEENDDNIYGVKGYSESNRVCISVLPEIFMANAFTPDGNGHNDLIKPILTFRPKSYLFAVYDRWGSKIFESDNADEYWDGKINGGKNGIPGVYIYYLKIITSGGILLEKKGTIALFYP